MMMKLPLSLPRIIRRGVHIEAKIKAMGLTLPPAPPEPKGNYMVYSKDGNIVYISGHVPQLPDGTLLKGRLGEDLTIEEGQYACRVATMQMLASLKAACGDNLDNVEKVIRVTGFVNSASTFTGQATVMNGCSDLIGGIFGVEIGRHARSALGVNVLPLGIAVELEAIVRVKNS